MSLSKVVVRPSWSVEDFWLPSRKAVDEVVEPSGYVVVMPSPLVVLRVFTRVVVSGVPSPLASGRLEMLVRPPRLRVDSETSRVVVPSLRVVVVVRPSWVVKVVTGVSVEEDLRMTLSTSVLLVWLGFY